METPTEAAMSSTPVDARPDRTVFAKYLVFFTLVWITLTQAVLHSWILGILVVPVATWMSVVVLSRETTPRSPPMSIGGLVKFLPFFFWQSLRGGWDSALFALKPGKRLQLGFMKYSTRLPSGRPRLHFLHVVSLLPGTVSAAVEGDDILIHALDISADHMADLRDCEEKVAALFGLNLEPGRAVNAVTAEDDVK